MMEQNFPLFSCHSSYFASMIQSVTGVLTRPQARFLPSPNPLGAHFPAQRLTIEPNKTLALAKTCQVGVRALGRLSFQCQPVNTPPPIPSERGPLLRFFLRGGVGVCTQAISVCLGQIVISVPNTYQTSTLAKMSSFSHSLCYTQTSDRWLSAA